MRAAALARPTDLREVPLHDALPLVGGACVITMSAGQWDRFLARAYEAGWTLLEVDDEERPVRAFRKAG